MGLEMKTVTLNKVNYDDLEEFVNEFFGWEDQGNYQGFPYSFVAVEECGNDSSHEFSVDGDLSEFDHDEIAKWIGSGGKTYISNSQVLNYLCWKGEISEGNYLVEVYW